MLGFTYKTAPDRNSSDFKWVSNGAVIATTLWIGFSLLFSFYIDNFGNNKKTYGSFTALIILMLLFYLTAYKILFGTEINSEIEHQDGRVSRE